jgi:hypothetical protein
MLVSFINEPDSYILDNLVCEFIYCGNCNKLVENPTLCTFYCSNKCSISKNKKNEKDRRNTNLDKHLSQKLSIQKNINKKYNVDINYDTDHLLSLGNNCAYCGISCKFGYEKESAHPDTLSFDKMDPDIGYIKENIVVCCWFCNRMKNQTSYEEWVQFIKFIKDKNELVLDLSNNDFERPNLSNILFHVKDKSPKYYSNSEDTKNIFIKLCKKQNYLDPFFNFFPIIHFGLPSMFNASIDAIDPSLPEEEKHRPDNIQVIPKCFNYGKNSLSNEQFLFEWNKREFKSDFRANRVILPENYYTHSPFNRMI